MQEAGILSAAVGGAACAYLPSYPSRDRLYQCKMDNLNTTCTQISKVVSTDDSSGTTLLIQVPEKLPKSYDAAWIHMRIWSLQQVQVVDK